MHTYLNGPQNLEDRLEIHKILKLGDNIVLPESLKQHASYKTFSVNLMDWVLVNFKLAFKKLSFLKKYLTYPLVFIIAFAFFYTVFNFSSLVGQVSATFNNQSQDEVVLGQSINRYYDWIEGYYFAVSDRAVLKATNDIDKDGLSNYDEFILQTNPTLIDSDNDGISDGLEVINESNPWGVGNMTADQMKLLESLDLIMINNRISFNVASLGLLNARKLPKIIYDLETNGVLSIPKLSLQIPIVWTKDPANFTEDLKMGAVHYPGTALPGETGTVYVAAHSSDYLWNNHPYTQVFSKLNFLEAGDDIFVDITGQDGKVYNYRYVVTEENIYKPDDQAQFIDNSRAKLNLSTCWPIGTQRDRYVVSAILQEI
jgi:LPXTG-site transpeptidase (sortase) family protein